MFSLNESNRFYLYTRPTDLRKGFNMLSKFRFILTPPSGLI